jgi:two-component system sensor histidine kinase UhpB
VWENTVALGLVALLVNLAMIGILYVIFGRVLDPLTSLASGLTALERQNYALRLPAPAPRELAGITDRFNALAEALETMRAENAALAHRLITAQDDERRRTAVELHDEVGPSLFGLKANATSIATAVASLPGDVPRNVEARVRDLLAIIEHLQTINRGILNRLRPMALGHVPLRDMLSQLVSERARVNPQIAFSLSAERLDHGYGDSADLTVYRCVQESLTNAIRHAQAKRIDVQIRETRGGVAAGDRDSAAQLELTIRDDGLGIDPSIPPGFGMLGMRERARALGGRYAVESGRGLGTCVQIAIPVYCGADSADARGAA